MTTVVDARETLLSLLAEYAYQYRPDNPFQLVSGATSPEYLDCKQALSQPQALPALGQLVHQKLIEGIDCIGGLTMGADPLAISAACWSAQTSRPVRWFSVRKEQKSHGARKNVEGFLRNGDRVAVVDDVVTSGASTIAAIQACQNAGYEVVQVVVLVDRENGGLNNIKQVLKSGVPVEALFCKRDIRKKWESKAR